MSCDYRWSCPARRVDGRVAVLTPSLGGVGARRRGVEARQGTAKGQPPQPEPRLAWLVVINTLIGGGVVTVGRVIARLRCSSCGSAQDWMRVADGTKGTTQGPVREVMLVQDRL